MPTEQLPVIKKFKYTPERRFVAPNTTRVLPLKELGASLVLDGNKIVLPQAPTHLGKLLSLAVHPGAGDSTVVTSGSDLIGSPDAETTASMTLEAGNEIVLRKIKTGWEVLLTLTIPTEYEQLSGGNPFVIIGGGGGDIG